MSEIIQSLSTIQATSAVYIILIIFSFGMMIVTSIWLISKIPAIQSITVHNVSLSKFNPSTSIEHPDYHRFHSIFLKFMPDVKDMFRAACIHNGFNLKQDGDYREYVESKIQQYESKFEKYINEYFIETRIVDRDILLDSSDYQTYKAEVSKLLHSLFDDLRKISIDLHIEIDKMYAERKKYIQEELADMENLCSIKRENNTNTCTGIDTDRVLRVITTASHQLIEISEKESRTILTKQMLKTEEYLLYIKDISLNMIRELLSKQVHEKKR